MTALLPRLSSRNDCSRRTVNRGDYTVRDGFGFLNRTVNHGFRSLSRVVNRPFDSLRRKCQMSGLLVTTLFSDMGIEYGCA